MTDIGSPSRPRLLIFVVAYEAESTLARVLKRIPDAIWECDVEVLVIDDSSRDRTFEVGLRWSAQLPYRVTVLHNTNNQGYGGNQKLGYSYGIRHGFDFVVLLHGDGQYAPERIAALLEPLMNGAADAVFGSRMMVPGTARRGGMPLYKFAGNRILTTFQNWLLGTQFTEFHSGFRAYRVSALASVPFQFNANAFHFDTEIIIQFLLAGLRIAEVPIPTYYGNEICRVDGIRYAKDVILATIASRLHRLNILYQRKFDVEPASNQHYKIKLGFRSSHTAALDAVSDGAHVLDIGCGPGDFAHELTRKGCVVDGVDQFAPLEPSRFRHFVRWQEPETLDVTIRAYDYVMLLDIIEHLKEPERFLERLRSGVSTLSRPPHVIVTSGNVAFWVIRVQAVLGHFNYGRRGILDLTHTRLYTFKSLRQLFEECGFRIDRIEGIPAPFPLVLHGWLGRALVTLNSALIRLSRALFAYQIFMVATPLPTIDSLLDDSIASSARKAADACDATNAVARTGLTGVPPVRS